MTGSSVSHLDSSLSQIVNASARQRGLPVNTPNIFQDIFDIFTHPTNGYHRFKDTFLKSIFKQEQSYEVRGSGRSKGNERGCKASLTWG
jgi:hypothetical protein